MEGGDILVLSISSLCTPMSATLHSDYKCAYQGRSLRIWAVHLIRVCFVWYSYLVKFGPGQLYRESSFCIFRVATMYYMYYRGKVNVLYGTILEKWVQNVLYWYYIFFS